MSFWFNVLIIFLLVFNLSYAQNIKQVEIRGLRYIPEDSIRGLIKSVPGSTYSLETVKGDIKRLYRTGFFEKVEVYSEIVGEDIVLIYQLTDLPVIYKIEFIGNKKLKADDLEKYIGIETEVGKIDTEEATRAFTSSPAIEERIEAQRRIKLGRVLSPQEIDFIKRRIEEAYLKEGYPNVEVSYELVPKKGASKIVFNIVEGQPEYLSSIHIEGNKSFRRGKIIEKMTLKPPSLIAFRFRPPFSEEILKEDIKSIEEFYKSEGFLDVKVFYEVKKRDSRYDVFIKIDEGQRYKLGDLKIEGNTLFAYSELVGNILKKNKGGYYRQDVINKLLDNIKAKYSYIGFMNVQWEKSENISDKKVNVTIKLIEGDPVYVGRIDVKGNYETRDYVIRREMRFQEGELANLRELERSKSRIFNLGYYEDVNIQPVPSSMKNWDFLANIRERFTGQISVGLGYNQVTKISGFVSIRKGNFLGTGDIAGFSISYGTRSRDNSLSYTKRWFLNQPIDLTTSIFDRRVEYSTYTIERAGINFVLSKELVEFWKASAGISFQRVKYSDISPNASSLIKQEEGTRQVRKLSFGLVRDTRDNFIFPTKGSLTELELSSGLKVLGGTEKFIKLSLSHQFFLKDTLFDTGVIWGLKGAFGMVEPYGGKRVPLDEKFFVGGDFSVRGYSYGYAGPLDPNIKEPVGAKKQVLFSTELNVPLYKNMFYGAVFLDLGRGADKFSDLKDLRGGYGIGVRFITPFAPIKLDLAFKTKKVPGDTDRSKIHFVLGAFF